MSRMAKIKQQMREKAQSQVQAKPVFREEPVVELPEGWVHLGTRNDKLWYRTAPAIAVAVVRKKVNYVREALKRLELNRSTFQVKQACPACNGTGYIMEFAHVAGGICYKCNDPRTKGGGKGWISAQDKAYNDARIKAGSLCDVRTA